MDLALREDYKSLHTLFCISTVALPLLIVVCLVFGMPMYKQEAPRLNHETLQVQLDELFAKLPAARAEFLAQNPVPPDYQSPFGDELPDALVFTSNSMRKALQMYWWLINYNTQSWPSFASHIAYHPEQLESAFGVHTFFENNIHNGDGTVREPFLIGFTPEGIPAILCPTDGEGHGNADPLDEAWKKIWDVEQLFEKWSVIFYSTDAVQDLRTAEGKLGKPENHPEFGKRVTAHPEHEADQYEEQVLAFCAWYIDTYYRPGDGEPLIDNHITGWAAKWGEQVYEELIQLSIEVQEEMLAIVEVCLQMGGGGIFQQLFKYMAEHDTEAWVKLKHPELLAYLNTIDERLWSFVVVFHIMGQAAWKIPAAAQNLVAQRAAQERTIYEQPA